ncbi:unnamed protein product [Ceutorhynchus assimilis]|uniref:TOG domain-containing protein n=1 Tax=Ceutorhynchus assimilis TaxID=467358 RepID=A0A9N9MKX5_9CUCU|nr:unnamed protein product [Ceutorhynchus assimilis]
MQTNAKLKPIKDHPRVKNLFDSAPMVVPGNRNVAQKSLNPDVLKETSTQTSKTMVSLPLEESARMSPDSLSPKTNYYQQESVGEPDFHYKRKGCILRYLHKPKDEIKGELFAEDSLIKVFLDKKKFDESFSPRVSRSSFLQQTSPLRKIVSGTTNGNFKSHSYVAVSNKPPTALTRFTVTKIREKAPVPDNTKPVKYFCEKELALNLKTTTPSPKITKNYSFMSPTFSSEQKNKMREIDTVTKLISPTRRGRSASPTPNVDKSAIKKVPYIDKSSSSIFHNKPDPGGYELNLKSLNLDSSNSTIIETCPDANNSENELMQAITKIREEDWNVALRGLAEVLEICRTCDVNIVYPHMTIINQRIIDMLKSSRSHVCRTTCKAIGHLFEYVKDTRRPEFDEIVDTLLCRTADSNKFIKHDANLALDCMVTHIPILHAIRSLCAKGPEHKNSLVRIATARLVVCAVVIAGSSYILNPNNSDFTRKRIIVNMVKFLNDKTLEARKYGDRLHKLLYSDRLFEIYVRRYLDKDTAQKLKVCLKNPYKAR